VVELARTNDDDIPQIQFNIEEFKHHGQQKSAEANLPSVSKPVAGGIAGAVIGGLVGGPVVATMTGIAGALVGRSSAKGEKPIGTAVKMVRSRLSGVSTPKMLKGTKPTKRKVAKAKNSATASPAKGKSKAKKAIKRAKKTPAKKKAKKRAKRSLTR
jgi:hypothetical protein